MTESQDLKIPPFEFPDNIFTFYLSHPCKSRREVRDFELGFEERHPKIALINPFYDVGGEGRRDILNKDAGKRIEKDAGYNYRLTRRDMLAIVLSRGILGIVDENSESSFGTPMEWVYARVLAKNPKLCICTNPYLVEHPWIQTHFHEVYSSFEEFEDKVEAQVKRVKNKWEF